MEKNNSKISRILSLVLRHKPEELGIELDKNGWTDVSTLMQKLRHRGYVINRESLKDIVATNDKKRFTFDTTNNRIRANQGHSVDVDLELVSEAPPSILYHGTGSKSLESIMKNGLEKRSRQHVHLSADLDTAIKVGTRHGRVVVLMVDTASMSNDGFEFFKSKNDVWLTDNVPSKYLKLC